MPCLCFGRRREHNSLFHWPNFTFSHSQQSIHPRRIHSTFSIQEKRKSRRVLKRKSTIQSEPTFRTSWTPKKGRQSLGSTETGAVVSHDPNETSGQDHARPNVSSTSKSRQRHVHVHWAGTGSKTSKLTISNAFCKCSLKCFRASLDLRQDRGCIMLRHVSCHRTE